MDKEKLILGSLSSRRRGKNSAYGHCSVHSTERYDSLLTIYSA